MDSVPSASGLTMVSTKGMEPSSLLFTVEDNKEDGSIPFVDTIVKPEADGTLSITVYRKPTQTDQYLQ